MGTIYDKNTSSDTVASQNQRSLQPKTRSNQCEAPLLVKKISTRMINKLIELKFIGGVVTPNDKAAEGKPTCKHDFKNEFARLP